MSAAPVHRLRLVRGKAAAFATDALLLAYALWCLDVLLHPGPTPSAPTLAARPWLLLVVPLLVALWEGRGTSPGLTGWRIRFVADPEVPGPPPPSRLAWRGLGAGLLAALVFAPLAVAAARPEGGGPWLLATAALVLWLG